VAYSQNSSSVSSLEAFERVGVFVIHVPLFRPSMGVGIIVIPVCVKSQIVLIDLEQSFFQNPNPMGLLPLMHSTDFRLVLLLNDLDIHRGNEISLAINDVAVNTLAIL